MNRETMLDEYLEKYGRFTVAYQSKSARKKWWSYHDYDDGDTRQWAVDGTLTDREIFSDEIVIETDLNMEAMNRSISERLCNILSERFNFKRYFSGGKSYHIHLFFPELLDIDNKHERKLIKQLFIRWLYGCQKNVSACGKCDKIWGYDGDKPIKCALIKHKVDMQLCTTHMIRIEHAHHPVTDRQKRLVETSDRFPHNRLPSEVWAAFERLNIKRSDDTDDAPRDYSDLPERQCVKVLLEKNLHDGARRAAFALYNNLKVSRGKDDAEKTFRQWAKKYPQIDEHEVDRIIHNGNQNNKAPGCDYIREILCDAGLSCPCIPHPIEVKHEETDNILVAK